MNTEGREQRAAGTSYFQSCPTWTMGLPWKRSVPEMEVLTMAPTLPQQRGAVVLQDPVFQGGAMEGAETYSPARQIMAHAEPWRCHFCHNSLLFTSLWKSWRERGSGRDDTVCRKRQWENVRGQGREEESSQSIRLEATRGHCTVKSTGQFYFQGRDVALSGTQSLSFAVPEATVCGILWNRGCSPAASSLRRNFSVLPQTNHTRAPQWPPGDQAH